MKSLMLTAAYLPTDLSVDSGMPLYILLPLVIAVAIVAVVGIRWLYKKTNE